MRSFNYNKKRTSNLDILGNRIPDTFNLSVSESRYVNKNTHFDIICNGKKCIKKPQIEYKDGEVENCCFSSKNRNPLLGYRKYRMCNNQETLGCSKTPTNTIYKDNWLSCRGKECYSKYSAPYTVYNRNGIRNPDYNNSYSQYLQRRVKTFDQLAFNFLSNDPLNIKKNSIRPSVCGSEFPTAAHNSTFIISDLPSKNSNQTPDCVPNCNLGCSPPDTVVNRDIKNTGVSPCTVKNNHGIVVYKRNNPNFSHQGAVSGGSRINRLKYQTVLKAQSKVSETVTSSQRNNTGSFNSSNSLGATNGTYPVSLYRNTAPIFKKNNNKFCVLRNNRNNSGRLQRCKINKGLRFSKCSKCPEPEPEP